jgi:hypothetical protein
MSLYRLDYIDSEGRATHSVRDLILGGDALYRRHSAALARAKTESRDGGEGVALTRISGGGAMRRMLIARDGRVTRA